MNEAINNQMQLEVMDGKKGAAEAFTDLSPYLGESKKSGKTLDPWESKTIAAIRGMSQSKLGVSTVTASELKFAQDTEEAKDVIDQTKQMNINQKESQSAAVDEQLAHAKAALEAASRDEVTLLEVSESQQEDFEPELVQGSASDIYSQIDQEISTQAGDKLGKLSSTEPSVQSGLDQFAKDAEQAQAQIQDMKASMNIPLDAPIPAKTADLGETAEVRSTKASSAVAKQLARARAKLLEAQKGLKH